MKEEESKKIKKNRRAARIRKKILFLGKRPRLTVFRSNRFIYAQIIDDSKAQTLISVSEKELEKEEKGTKTKNAEELGKILAKKATAKKIKEVAFDKGSYRYHGRVKVFADAARKEGLNF